MQRVGRGLGIVNVFYVPTWRAFEGFYPDLRAA